MYLRRVGCSDGRRCLVGVHGMLEPNGETLPMDIWPAYMAMATQGGNLDFPVTDLSDLEILEGDYSSGF